MKNMINHKIASAIAITKNILIPKKAIFPLMKNAQNSNIIIAIQIGTEKYVKLFSLRWYWVFLPKTYFAILSALLVDCSLFNFPFSIHYPGINPNTILEIPISLFGNSKRKPKAQISYKFNSFSNLFHNFPQVSIFISLMWWFAENRKLYLYTVSIFISSIVSV